MTQRRAHYVLSTHWDREWYQTFQDYRYRLVQLLDRVFDGLEDGRLQGPFQTDGQAIILEDYLEVRPERRPQIERFAREGKLVIGPWYVLPDEFLVSGESLIRNIELGRRVARAFGGRPSDAGFACDLFGHTSQMPQVFAGFGIRGGFIWRGLNPVAARHVIWRGADGTEMPCYRFVPVGYCSFAFQVRHANDRARVFDAEQVDTDLSAYLEQEAEASEVDPLLVFDGGDHQEWDTEVYSVVAGRMRRGDGRFAIVHSSLDAYLEEMLPQSDRIALTVEGELREPGVHPAAVDQQWLIPGVLSSRVWIKQQNAACQTALCHWAEPLGVMAGAAIGSAYPQGFLDVAWRWLLKNHPHDSICGCSIDAVHEDMKFRFHQALGIADRLTTQATRAIGAHVAGEVTPDDLRVVVFNPLPQAVDGPTELDLQIPTDWPTFNEFFGFEPKPAFRVFDAQGNELPYQRLAQAMGRSKVRVLDTRFPQSYKTNDVRVALPLSVPATGYTTLTVRAGEEGLPTRHPTTPGLATSERSMANEHLAVAVEPNGTLTVTDRETGQAYTRLLTFEDCADIGDGWFHGMAVNEQVYTSTACSADVALVHDGPFQATFRLRVPMRLPDAFRFDGMTRSDAFIAVVIDSLVTLRRGARHVEVETTVDNRARDHRLRVLFPTGADADTYLSDAAFDVVERPIALRADNHNYRELEVETKPQQSWTAVFGADRGLAVVSVGLLESAVRDLPERPIALTLLRATRRTVMTDGEPEGQLQGPLTFRYWIVPLAGEPDRAGLCRLGQRLAAGLRAAQLRPEDMAYYRKGVEGPLPPAASLLRVEGDAVVTSLRRNTGGIELRLFNPLTTPTTAQVHLGDGLWAEGRPARAERVDLEGHALTEVSATGAGGWSLPLRPKEIATLRLSTR